MNLSPFTENYEAFVKGKRTSKKRNLEDLFRPPVDITHKGTFQNVSIADIFYMNKCPFIPPPCIPILIQIFPSQICYFDYKFNLI